MADLAVELQALRNPVLTGESLFVIASIVNHGSKAAEVPAESGPSGASPFRYRLHPLTAGVHDFEISYQQRLETRIHGTPPQFQTLPPTSLPPAYRSGRTEDLTDLASQPFPPGKYELRVTVFAGGSVLESPPIVVEIVAPKPDSLVTAFCRESGNRISAFAQNTSEGWTILQEQASIRRPEWSVFQRYTLNPGPKGPVSLAVSVDEGQYIGARWLGWMEGSTLSAARFLPYEEIMPDPIQHSVDSGLGKARLLSPGFQRPDGSALFLAYGDGKLAAFRFADEGARRLWQVESVDDLTNAAISLAPGASLTFVYTAGNQLRYQRWSLDGKPLAGATDLFSLAHPMVSLHLEEVAAEPKLEIVMGPAPEPKYNVVRWTLNADPKPTVSSVPGFSLPPDSLKAAAWGDHIEVVAGFATGYARFSLPGDTRWRPNRPGLQTVSLDRDVDGRIWLHALQPDSGFRWIALDGVPMH